MKIPTPIVSSAAVALAVSLALAGCASNRTNREELSDRAITSKITAKLAADPEINPFKIDVDTLDGVVTLRGEVRKASVKAEAQHLATATTGVRRVENRIEVIEHPSGEQPVTDAWITTRVKTKLAADPELNPFNIDVDTEDGVVTLSGRVATRAASAEAEKLARGTKGVVEVRNELQVASPS